MPDTDPLSRRRKRRRMLAFKLEELSGVDRPAQQPALVALFKRQQHLHPRQEDPMPQQLVKVITGGEHAPIYVYKTIPESAAPRTFTAAVAAIKSRDGCTQMQAMQKARNEHYDLFQKSRVVEVQVNKGDGRPNPAVMAFNKCVSEIVARDKCPRSVAMQRAREEHPDEFEAYQSAS